MFRIGEAKVLFLELGQRDDIPFVANYLAKVWRNNRGNVTRMGIVRDDDNDNAYMEPNEISALMHDYPTCPIDFFTFLQCEKEAHLDFIKNRLKLWNAKKLTVDIYCCNNWKLPKDLSVLIWKHVENEPPICKCDPEKLLRPHWGSNDNLEFCCKLCSIYRNNPIYKIVDATNELLDDHETSDEHIKAIKLASKYYNELEVWAQCDNDIEM